MTLEERGIASKESEEENPDYYSIIEKSKEELSNNLSKITNDAKKEIKNRLLETINICSKTDSDNKKTLLEILDILSNEKLVNEIGEKGLSQLYLSLGDNYFLLGDMKRSLYSYEHSFNLGKTEIIDEIFFIYILQTFSDLKNTTYNKSNIYEIIKKIEELEVYLPNIKGLETDINEILLGEGILIKNPNNVSDHIYNLELTEKEEIKNLSNINIPDDILEGIYDYIKSGLKDGYDELLEDYGEDKKNKELIELAKNNMLKRALGEKADCIEYGVFKDKFFDTAFDVIEAYFKNNLTIEPLNIFSLLKNMGLEEYFKDEYKALIGEIYLSMGYSREAYLQYFINIGDSEIQSPKIKLLLEDILLKVDFTSEDNYKFIINIQLLLEKINNGKVLKIEDYQKITELCDL